MINRRNFIKVATGFVGGVFATFVPKAIGSKPSNMRPVTAEDRENYCRDHIHKRQQCAFRRETGERCMINSWKETPVESLMLKCEEGWHPDDDREATIERMRADGPPPEVLTATKIREAWDSLPHHPEPIALKPLVKRAEELLKRQSRLEPHVRHLTTK